MICSASAMLGSLPSAISVLSEQSSGRTFPDAKQTSTHVSRLVHKHQWQLEQIGGLRMQQVHIYSRLPIPVGSSLHVSSSLSCSLVKQSGSLVEQLDMCLTCCRATAWTQERTMWRCTRMREAGRTSALARCSSSGGTKMTPTGIAALLHHLIITTSARGM